MTRAFILYCMILIAVSVAFSSAARAERSPQQDYCLKQTSACMTGCESYSATIWGVSVPTLKTTLCVGECSIAYVGCLMMRFRDGA